MRTRIPRAVIAIAAALAALAHQGNAFGQEPSQAISSTSSTSPATATPFTLILLGTRHQKDVEVIRQNLLAQPNVVMLVPSAASQGRLEFSGRFTGSPAELATDVRGLAVDRFEVAVHDDAARGLVLTLRKIREDSGAK